MAKFKIGDKVVANKSWKVIDEIVAGQVYTVVEADNYVVKLEGQQEPWGVGSFELNSFQVGDEVKIAKTNYRVEAVHTNGILDVSTELAGYNGEPPWRTTYLNQDPKLFTFVRRPTDHVVIDEKAIEKLKAYNDELLERAIKAEDRARCAVRDLEEKEQVHRRIVDAEREESARLLVRVAETEHALRTARGSLCAEIDDLKRRNQSLQDKLNVIKDERNKVGSRYHDEAQNARKERDDALYDLNQARKDLERSRQHCASQKRTITELNRCIVKRNDQLELARLERDEARDALAVAVTPYFSRVPFFVGVDFAAPHFSVADYAARLTPKKPTHCGLRVGDRVRHRDSTVGDGTVVELRDTEAHNDLVVEWDSPVLRRCQTFSKNVTLIPGGRLEVGDKAKHVDGTLGEIVDHNNAYRFKWSSAYDSSPMWAVYSVNQLIRVIETEQ